MPSTTLVGGVGLPRAQPQRHATVARRAATTSTPVSIGTSARRGTSHPLPAGRIARRSRRARVRRGIRANASGKVTRRLNPSGTDVRWRVQQPLHRSKPMQTIAAQEPMDAWCAHEHLHLGAGLVQQSG